MGVRMQVTEPDGRMICSVGPQDGLDSDVYEGFGHFRLVRSPDVQLWLQGYYAAGTSPGWLLHDGTQVW